MENFIKSIQGFGLSILFVLLGTYIFNISQTILGKIIGITCIIFFGGIMIWAIFKKIKQNKL